MVFILIKLRLSRNSKAYALEFMELNDEVLHRCWLWLAIDARMTSRPIYHNNCPFQRAKNTMNLWDISNWILGISRYSTYRYCDNDYYLNTRNISPRFSFNSEANVSVKSWIYISGVVLMNSSVIMFGCLSDLGSITSYGKNNERMK